jgi:tetratricopeptide (TPR) repeat protein
MTMRLFFLITFSCFILATPIFAETNSISSLPAPSTTDVLTQNLANGYLQIQEQLHDAQLAIENTRREMATEAKQNADAMTTRIQSLEQVVATQRAEEIQTAQKNQQFTLAMAGAFGLTVLAAVLFMAYLQWRAVGRLVEMSALRRSEFSMGNGRAGSLVSGAATVENSNGKLFDAVDHLQKRILELEQTARGALAEKTLSSANGSEDVSEQNGSPVSDDREECVTNLVAEGQSLLDAHDPEKALECFEVALGLDPKHLDALVKKGSALEKLGRMDEAIACYDRAIEMNNSPTIAYLQKGGLFNRMARYDEALQCYEQALRTQEKKQAA